MIVNEVGEQLPAVASERHQIFRTAILGQSTDLRTLLMTVTRTG